MFITLFSVCIISAAFVDAFEAPFFHSFHTRAEPESQHDACDRAFALLSKGLEVMKASDEFAYYMLAHSFRSTFNVDMLNPVELKALICKVTGAKTLRGLYDSVKPNTRSYESVVRDYRYLQKLLGQVGGYTNIPRMWMLAQDIMEFVESAPDMKTNLTDLTRFLEVMQVKYGSRWISLLGSSKNQMLMIEDPEAMAKKLYECKSRDEVAALFKISSKDAHPLYRYLLYHDMPPVPPELVNITQQAVPFITIMGDEGIFNLPYDETDTKPSRT